MAGNADKPKHAPSPKHALDEVLRSLQDLVRNELHDAPVAPNATAPAAPSTAGETAAPPTADEMIARLESSLAALQPTGAAESDTQRSRVTAETADLVPVRAAPDRATEKYGSSAGTDVPSTPVFPQAPDITRIAADAALTLQDLETLVPPSGDSTESLLSSSAPKSAPQAVTAARHSPPAAMQQQALPLPDPAQPVSDDSAQDVTGDDAAGSGALADRRIAAEERRAAATPGSPPDPSALRPTEIVLIPELHEVVEGPPADNIVAPLPQATESPVAAPSASMHESHMGYALHAPAAVDVHWDDIPVLENAIDLATTAAPRPAAADTPSPPESAARDAKTDASAVPVIDAHKLAILAAARLNMELKKSGKRALSTTVIARLAKILEETLARGAPNVENSPGKED